MTKKLFTLISFLSLVGATIVVAQTQASPELFPIFQNGKVGYIDHAGKIVIEPKFKSSIGPSDSDGHFQGFRYFHEGLAAIDEGGFINEKGVIIISGRVYTDTPFKNGVVVIRDCRQPDSCLQGVIDKTGKSVIKSIYRSLTEFSEGLAAAENNQGKWGYIDEKGNVVIPFRYLKADSFSDGFAFAVTGIRRGYIDRRGKFIPMPKDVEQFLKLSENMIAVKIGDKLGFINTRGEIVIQPQFEPEVRYEDRDLKSVFIEGLASVKSNGKWGYIDRTGKWIVPAQFEQAEAFDKGIAAVKREGKWGFVSRTGKIIFEPQFEEAEKFVERVARVKAGGKWGFVNKEGKFAVTPKFDDAKDFSGGLAAVAVGEKWGYIDSTGKFVIKPQFGSGGLFKGSLARQHIKTCYCKRTERYSQDEWGYLDRTGKIVWKSETCEKC